MIYLEKEITKGTSKQIKFAKDLQKEIFDDIKDSVEDNEDNSENIVYFLNRLGNNAVNWINAIHKYNIKIYTCNHSTKEALIRKLNIALK